MDFDPITIKNAEKILDAGQRELVVTLIQWASKNGMLDLSRYTATLSSNPFRRNDMGKYVTAVVQTESDKTNKKGSDFEVRYDETDIGNGRVAITPWSCALNRIRDLTDDEKREFSEGLDGSQEPQHKETE